MDQIKKQELRGVPEAEPSTPQAVIIPPSRKAEEVQFPEVQIPDSPTPVKDSEMELLLPGTSLELQETHTPPVRRTLRERCPPDYNRP